MELVKKEMGIQEVFEKEGIEVTEQEILAEMTSTAEQFEGMNETFDPQKLREQIIETLKVTFNVQLHSFTLYTAPLDQGNMALHGQGSMPNSNLELVRRNSFNSIAITVCQADQPA